MGLLDDAIREHLELKRRRGADPDEVARQEDEALGDPRSGEFARPEGAQDDVALADVPNAGTEEEQPADSVGARAAPPAAPASEPAPAAENDRSASDEPWLPDDQIEPPGGQPTAAFSPPDVDPEPDVARPDEQAVPDEDVLEETPEFLQETPEHDRLWFEQKPPRDFDFDR